MLDDLPVRVEAEHVDARPRALSGPVLKTVQDDVIPFSDDAFELHTFAGILRGHAREVLDERLLAIADARIVLDVLGTGIPLDRVCRPTLIKHQVVKRLRIPLVAFESFVHGSIAVKLARLTSCRSAPPSPSAPAGRLRAASLESARTLWCISQIDNCQPSIVNVSAARRLQRLVSQRDRFTHSITRHGAISNETPNRR
jgi:hypothetical protein